MKKHLFIVAFVLTGILSSTSGVAQVIAYPPSQLVICEVIFDEQAEFDLTLTEPEIIGGQDPTNLVVTYYQTLAEADNALNPIVVPESYFNLANPQTIFARLEDSSNGDFDITNFEISVVNSLNFVEVSLFSQCDDEVVDGVTEFDLNSQNSTITGGNSYLFVSYYATQADALTANNPLVNPYINTTNPETIYVRVDGSLGDCYEVFAMDLEVVAPPEPVSPTPLEVCDENNNDGYAEFDLHVKDSEIAGGNSDVYITYHFTFLDAEFNVNPLTTPYVNEIPFYQIVYARVEDLTTGCFATVELELIINLPPEIVTVSDYIILDENNDGIEIFDLTIKVSEILDGQAADVTFYETQQDAINNVNVIANPTAYINITNPQTIYTRLENLDFCFSTGSFIIFAEPNLGVDNNLLNNLRLYPNPSTGIINIQSSNLTETVEVAIYNLQGQELVSDYKTPENGTIRVDVSSLSTGVYFIKIVYEGNTIVKKIIRE